MADEKPAVPVTIYAENPRVPRTLRVHLEAQRDSAISGLATGAAKDYPAYRELIGRIAALSDAVDICKQVENDLSGTKG